MDENNQNTETGYIQERLKSRPLNRKKLMRRTIITASMAVIFGVLACFTFLVLEPVFSNFLYPEEEPKVIEIPEDTNEMLPEDMMLQEDKKSPVQPVVKSNSDDSTLSDYVRAYSEVYDIATETKKSMVTVTSVSQDTDWFDNEYENKGQTSGVFVANNGKEALILVESSIIEDPQNITVTFSNNQTAPGVLKQSDVNTGLSIVAVELSLISSETMEEITPATLGNSMSDSLLASPVIAIGRPYGNTESVAFGMISAKGMYVNLADDNYEMLMTDIYGSVDATGIIVNFDGEVLGVIDQSHNTDETKNLIRAIAVSDIKKTIERMSNGRPRAYLGVIGTDVTKDANENLGVPSGAYVTGIEMGSPAMNAGIQSGDVIVKIGETEISRYDNLTDAIYSYRPDAAINVVIARQTQDGYKEIELGLQLSEQK